ncbi:uncharacterized protein C1orf105 homolog [Trichechus inunguis]
MWATPASRVGAEVVCPWGHPTDPPGSPLPATAPHPAVGLRWMAEEKGTRKHRRPLGTHLPAGSQGCSARGGRPPASFPIRDAGVATATEQFRFRPHLHGKSVLLLLGSTTRTPLPPPGRSEDLLAALPGTGPKPNAGNLGKLIPTERQVSVPKFDKIPWLSEASFINKPLVLSLPKRSPQSSTTILISSKKDMNLPFLFQVPDALSKVSRSQSNSVLLRNRQLCSTCRERKMVQPRTMLIPDDLKLSFENFMSHRMMGLHPPRAKTVPKLPHDDILTENIDYRLPILGPRTAVFQDLLSDAYRTLQERQLSSLPRKGPISKTMRR